MRTALDVRIGHITIPAGTPDALEGLTDEINLYDYLVPHPDHTYGFRVTGESMIDDNILPGDFILVDAAIPVTADSIIVVKIDGGCTVKRFSHIGTKLYLVPSNKTMQAREVETDCELIGVVTHVIHRTQTSLPNESSDIFGYQAEPDDVPVIQLRGNE